MYEFINKHATGKKVVLFIILTNIVYVLMKFVTIPKILNYAGGLRILDMMNSGYDFEYVNTLFESLGAEGRNAYLYTQIPLDLIFPLLYGLGGFLLLAYLFKKIDVKNSNIFYLSLIPIVGGFFDYLENFGTINLLVSYPEISPTAVQFNNIFTLLKNGFITLFFVVLILFFVVFVFIKVKNIRAQKE